MRLPVYLMKTKKQIDYTVDETTAVKSFCNICFFLVKY